MNRFGVPTSISTGDFIDSYLRTLNPVDELHFDRNIADVSPRWLETTKVYLCVFYSPTAPVTLQAQEVIGITWQGPASNLKSVQFDVFYVL